MEAHIHSEAFLPQLWEAEIGALETLILGTPPETPVLGLGQDSGTSQGFSSEFLR